MLLRICYFLFSLLSLRYVMAADLDQDAVILRQENIIEPDGKYQFGFETSNGIQVEEEGEGGVNAIGFYKYINPDGETVQVNYIADDYGFQPDNLPEVPEIPPLIQKALAYVAANTLAKKK